MTTATERIIREQFAYWPPAQSCPLPDPGAAVVVTGCGSSYYLAQSIAAAFNESGRPALAIPAAEWLVHPRAYLPDAAGRTVIGLSRSGTTTETLDALAAAGAAGLRTIAVTCAPGSAIEQAADLSVALPTHPDEGVVMSVSASLMLIAGLRMAGVVLPTDLPMRAEAVMAALDRQAWRLTARRHFAYLGGGTRHGVACEGALKLMEMSITPAQAFHPLEYRHGPISLIDGGSAVILLHSDDPREAAVAADVQAKGGLVLGIDGPGDIRIDTGVAGAGAGLAALPALQLLGERVAQARGIDSTRPRNLTKVVVLA
jgi:glucosamine--fructose-6-phosphate aminotransferase (isomerizing)